MDNKTLHDRLAELYIINTLGKGKAHETAPSDAITLKPRHRPCEDCGDMVQGRSVTYVLRRDYKTQEYRGWDKKCSECKTKWNDIHPVLLVSKKKKNK
jgi:hypothetical protein